MSKTLPMIPTAESYVPVGRNLINTDTPEKGYASYQRDIAVRAGLKNKRGTVTPSVVEFDDLDIPQIELAAHPRVSRGEVDRCHFDLWARIEARSHDAIKRLEDREVFKILDNCVPSDHLITAKGHMTPEVLGLAISLIQGHELRVGAITCHPNRFHATALWNLTKYNIKFRFTKFVRGSPRL